MKRPSFQFYPHDWMSNLELHGCSLAARGLWIELICLMHQADPYGFLVLNGNPIAIEKLARKVGSSPKEVKALLDELEEDAVFSRDENGRIYCRRMVRDESVRNVRAAGGPKGGSHGAKGAEFGHLGGRPKGSKKPPLDAAEEPGLKPPPTSSSSSTSTESKDKSLVGQAADAANPTGVEFALTGDQLVLEPPAPSIGDRVQKVFDYWRVSLNHPQSKLGDPSGKRYRTIERRIEEGYTVEQLCTAIDGCRKTPHNMGINDRKQVFDDVELICRSQGQVDRFIRNAANPDIDPGAAIASTGSIADRIAADEAAAVKRFGHASLDA